MAIFYTSCASCGDTLNAVFVGQETHPGCESTAAELAARQFVEAIQRGDEDEARRLEGVVNQADEPPSLGAAALWYASIGWPVLPLAVNAKAPATRHGLNDATTDAAEIAAWWEKHPDSNIGIRTGVMFDVIDIDGPEGIQSVKDLAHVLPEIHGRVGTPRGFHYLVAPTGDGNRAGVRPGIDYRGQGGFCVAPPSVVGGKRYLWLMRPSPQIVGKAHARA